MNVLLISHDGIASGAKRSAELILGEQDSLAVIELTAADGIGFFGNQLAEFISQKVHNKQQLLIISDLQNGSPYNAAAAYIVKHDLEEQVVLLSGMNLNMVLESVLLDDEAFTSRQFNQILETSIEGITRFAADKVIQLAAAGDE